MRQQLLMKQLDDIKDAATKHLMVTAYGSNQSTMKLAEDILATFEKDYTKG